jgi:hypothetical protein
MRAGELPGDPEVEEPYSLEDVFNWLQNVPEQIARAVIIGGAAARSDGLLRFANHLGKRLV